MNKMLSVKEVFEALLKGEVLVDITDRTTKIYLDTEGNLRDEDGDVVRDISLYDWIIETKTININGYEVPEPIRAVPKIEETYYAASLENGIVKEYKFQYGGTICSDLFKRGILHSTKGAAKLHLNALLSFTEI